MDIDVPSVSASSLSRKEEEKKKSISCPLPPPYPPLPCQPRHGHFLISSRGCTLGSLPFYIYSRFFLGFIQVILLYNLLCRITPWIRSFGVLHLALGLLFSDRSFAGLFCSAGSWLTVAPTATGHPRVFASLTVHLLGTIHVLSPCEFPHVRICKYGYGKFSTCNILSIIHVYNTCLRHIYTHVYGIFIPILFALDIHFMYVMRTLYILNAFATLIIFCTPHAIWDCCFLRISYATLSLGSISWYNDFFLRSSPQIALSDSGILHTCLSLWGRWFIGGSDPAVLWLPGSCSSEIRILHLLSQVLTIVLNFVPVSRYLLQLGLIVIHPWWYDLLHDHFLILIP